MITKTRKGAYVPARKTPVTASAINRQQAAKPTNRIFASLTPAQRAFAAQIKSNIAKAKPIMAATNTSNIMARPDFLELLPMFVQKLLVTEVFGSVAMKSRQQLIPYFKFIAENTKGETKAGDILSSPFVNRQGIDSNFTGRVVKNEVVGEGTAITAAGTLVYTPVLPNSVTIMHTAKGVTTRYIDNGDGDLVNAATNATAGYINYSNGAINITGLTGAAGDTLKATYQYDNENVGVREGGNDYGYGYGAQMGKGYLQLDEFNLVAETHQLACYTSIYAAFSAKQEYGASLSDIAKEAAFGEITAEINSAGFKKLKDAATVNPQFDWDASPVLSSAVVPSDYLNMLKLKLNEAASSVYKTTGLARPNRIVCGTTAAEYISMIYSFEPAAVEDTVGPYRRGKLDQFEVFVDPFYDVNEWVMCCKSDDIRRNSAIFGEYMPLTATDPITLANGSVQQGYATMYSMKVVNPATVLSGKILGAF